MSVDKLLKETLDALGYPVQQNVYTGEAKSYFVFNYDTSGDAFSDNAPKLEKYLVQVHFYCPLNENPNKVLREAKLALFMAGFSWPERYSGADENCAHYILETEIWAGGLFGTDKS